MTAQLIIRASCSNTVYIATLVIDGRTVYESRAWGTAFNAADDARAYAAQHGITVTE